MATLRRKLAGTSRPVRALGAMALGSSLIALTTLSVAAISVDRVDAAWGVNGEVGESSLVIPIHAAHPACPSWSNLGGLVVDAVETETSVTITATFPLPGDDQPCRWLGSAMPATVKLDGPLGDRALIDGGTGLGPATPVSIAFYTGQSPAPAITTAER